MKQGTGYALFIVARVLALVGVAGLVGYKIGQHHPTVQVERKVQEVYMILDDPHLVFYGLDGDFAIALVDRNNRVIQKVTAYDGKPCTISAKIMANCRITGGYLGEVEGEIRLPETGVIGPFIEDGRYPYIKGSSCLKILDTGLLDCQIGKDGERCGSATPLCPDGGKK